MQNSKTISSPFFIATAVLVIPFLLLWWFPVMTDEAYYLTWAKRSVWPHLGFFDHPPFVSWQASLARFSSLMAVGRLGVWVSSLITFLFTWRTGNKILGSPTKAWTAAIVAASTLAGIANAILLTPDSGLAMWWAISVHEAVAAIQGRPKRWLTAGLAVGFGLLSKYTMVLIGPVFLWALLTEGREQLRKPWPYLGALLTVAVFLPHLYWNSQHDWVTFRFQFGHGFSVRNELSIGSSLPKAESASKDSSEMKLHDALQVSMDRVPGFEETKSIPEPPTPQWKIVARYLGDYAGGVLGLWGVYAITIVVVVFGRIRRWNSTTQSTPKAGWSLIQAATFWPILFFGVLSPFTKVEANWPAMHMMGGAILLAQDLPARWRTAWAALGVHTCIAFALCVMAEAPDWIPNARSNRLVVETSGYQQLSRFIRDHVQIDLLAVDSYQLRSALAYYEPSIKTLQWPGITRPSEFTRGDDDDLKLEAEIGAKPYFTLLTTQDVPPLIPGYVGTHLDGIRACPDGTLGQFSVDEPTLPCEHGLREWWMVRYEKIARN